MRARPRHGSVLWVSIAAIGLATTVGCSDGADGGDRGGGSTTTTEGAAASEDILRWSEPSERAWGLLIADDLLLVAGATDLTAYDIDTGEAVWSTGIGQTVGLTPMALDGDTIVVARPYDVAQAFSLGDGAVVPDYDGPVPDQVPQSLDTPPGYRFGGGELRFEGEVVYTDPRGPASRFGPVVARIDGFSILSTFISLTVVSDDGEVLFEEAFESAFDEMSGWVVDHDSGFAAAWLADGRLHVLRLPV